MITNRTARLSLALLLASAASPALAQLSGGLSVPQTSGNVNPSTIMAALLGILFLVGGGACIAGWVKVALSFFGHTHCEPRYVWGVAGGTLILGSAGWIAMKALGGGGLGLSL